MPEHADHGDSRNLPEPKAAEPKAAELKPALQPVELPPSELRGAPPLPSDELLAASKTGGSE